jgi:hypothetical protein
MACHPTAFDMYKYDDVRFVEIKIIHCLINDCFI